MKRCAELGQKSGYKGTAALHQEPEAEHGLDSVLDEFLASRKERKRDS